MMIVQNYKLGSAGYITPINFGMAKVKVKPQSIANIARETVQKFADCMYFIDKGGLMVGGKISPEYVNIRNVQRAEIKARRTPLGLYVPYRPAYTEEQQILKPSYYIEHLKSNGKGQGTRAVQKVVKKSLEEPLTEGRVTLQTFGLEGESHTSGFFYKLGFRFLAPDANQSLDKWLLEGGKKADAPHVSGFMFLPKENIEHCLNYIPKP